MKKFHFPKLMKLIVSFLLFAGCIFGVNIGFAQTKYLEGNYRIENYTKKQGLPEDIVIGITQDRKGYMWLTTPYSLLRFDGYEFKIFSTRDQFPDLYVHFYNGLLEDSRGIIWMATMEMGLFSFNPQTEKFTRYYEGDHPFSISNNSVRTLSENNKGNIWAGTERGLNCLSFTKGGVKISQFTMKFSEEILQYFDTIVDQTQALVSIVRVGNLETKQAFIDVKETSRYFVLSMGEAGDTYMADFGWIENSSGKVIWQHKISKSLSAGGDAKNKQQLEIIQLPPGKYKVVYKTDDSHSWNSWNAPPPIRPDLWGIQVFKLSTALTDTINRLIKNVFITTALHDDYIKAFLNDSSGNTWALTGVGLEKLHLPSATDPQLTSEKIELTQNFYPYNLVETKIGQLMIAGYLYDSISKKTNPAWLNFNYTKNSFRLISQGISVPPSGRENTFLMDRNGFIWMGSFNDAGDGLYIAENGKESSTFRRLNLRPPGSGESGKPPFEQIWSVYQDRSGYIWVGSRQSGLYKIKTQKSPVNFIPIYDNTKKELKLSHITEDASNNIWVNTGDQKLLKYNIQNKQVSSIKEIQMDSIVGILFKPKEKILIVTGKKQIKEYDSAQSGFKISPLFVPDSLRVIMADSYDNYWAINKTTSNVHKLFFIYDGEKFQPAPFDSSGNQYGSYRDIHFGRNGNIWLAPVFEGLHQYKFDNVSKKIAFVKKFLPEGYDIYDIYEDEQGIVWIGSYINGLIKLNPSTGKFTSFTKNEGMPSNFIIKIIPAGKNLWVITDLGTLFINKETGVININKELDEYISQYAVGSLYSTFLDQHFGAKALVTRSGEIAFIGKNGLCIFNPSDVSVDSSKPVLHITGLHIGKQSIAFEETQNPVLKFNHNQNDLEIDYVGLHFDQPSLNKYAYLLKGANDDWVSAGTEKAARYSNLQPGRYEFYLKCANADGVWSDSQKMFSFIIRPPWWQTWWAYGIYLLLFLAVIRFIHNFQKERTIRIERERTQKKELEQAREIDKAYKELKSTQSQLIQSEKMASLGELTAGIAHEIQNPLNFVNNFSEVSNELIVEIEEERAKNPESRDENLVSEILSDIKQNLEKINHHGKRAADIVKGMLQHSRTSSGVKEPTDINALADEYLRLAYHGLRAKDKSFNAEFKTDFDPNLPKINVIPQDIGRVLLNLINNAFYAVDNRAKLLTPPPHEDRSNKICTYSHN